MKSLMVVLTFSLTFLSIACPTRSMFPLFTEKDQQLLPGLEGGWKGPDGQSFTLKTKADRSYDIIALEQSGERTAYEGLVGKLGKNWFVDSYPTSHHLDHHLLRAHVISRIQLEGDSLRMSSLEDKWLKTHLEMGDLNIAHIVVDGDVILTATTEELQRFVAAHADDKEAFPNPGTLSRVK
jgi:hypothetical protein